LLVNFGEYIFKIAVTRSILAQNAPNSVWRPDSSQTRWGRHPSWNKGSLLLREVDGREWREVEGREWEERERGEGKVMVEGPLLWILDTSLLLHDHSGILLLLLQV